MKPFDSLPEKLPITPAARNTPYTFLEKILWEIEGLGLHILRQAEGDCASFCRGSQYSHRLGKSSQQLLRALHPVPIPRDRFETVIYRNDLSERGLHLL